jgi:anti-anti-sigma factor
MTDRRPPLRIVRERSPSVLPPHEGDIGVYDEGDVLVVLMRGPIDLNAGEELELVGGYAIDKGLPIMVDVRQVTFIDSVGLSFLVRLASSAAHHDSDITLCGPAPLVRELLQIAGAERLFFWVDGR